jgi:hypothetical protein
MYGKLLGGLKPPPQPPLDNLFLGCSTTLFKPVDINREQVIRFYTCTVKSTFQANVNSCVYLCY